MFIKKGLLSACLTAVLAFTASAFAQEQKVEPQILFTNVNVFDGKSDKLAEGMSVLVEGNLIKKVAKGDIEAEGATVIDGGGRTLMPGLIDGHVHFMINDDYGKIETDRELADLAYNSVVVANRALMDGFTAARDMGGPAFALQRAIDSGLIPGPRIYPSGAFISQTSGHGDFRERGDTAYSINDKDSLPNFERFGIGVVADGVPSARSHEIESSPRCKPDQDHGWWRRFVSLRSD